MQVSARKRKILRHKITPNEKRALTRAESEHEMKTNEIKTVFERKTAHIGRGDGGDKLIQVNSPRGTWNLRIKLRKFGDMYKADADVRDYEGLISPVKLDTRVAPLAIWRAVKKFEATKPYGGTWVISCK